MPCTTHKSWNCAQNFFFKTCKQRTSKMRLNFMANSFVFDTYIVKMRPEHFIQSMQGKNVKNVSELRSKQLCFWMQKSRKCAENFFCKPCKAKTSKMCLNITENHFVTGHIYRDIAPGTFLCKLCRQRTSKMHLNFRANSFVLDSQIVELHPQLFL